MTLENISIAANKLMDPFILNVYDELAEATKKKFSSEGNLNFCKKIFLISTLFASLFYYTYEKPQEAEGRPSSSFSYVYRTVVLIAAGSAIGAIYFLAVHQGAQDRYDSLKKVITWFDRARNMTQIQ